MSGRNDRSTSSSRIVLGPADNILGINAGDTRRVLDGSDPGDGVNIVVRDFGVAVADGEVVIYVDGGNVGLLRLVSTPDFANSLVLLMAKALCEHKRLSF